MTQRGGINPGLPFVLYHISGMSTTVRFRRARGSGGGGTFFYALFYNGLFYSTAFLCVTSSFFFFLVGGRRFWFSGSPFGNAVGEESLGEADVLCVVVCVDLGRFF